MNKNLLIIVTPFNFNKHDFERHEVKYYKEYIDVIVLEIGELIYPNLYKFTEDESLQSEELIKIKSFSKLFHFLKNLKDQYSKVVFTNLVKPTNLNTLVFNFLLKYFNISYISCINPGIAIIKRSSDSTLWNAICLLVKDKGFKFILIQIYFLIMQKIHKIFHLPPKYILIAGDKYYQQHKTLFSKNIKVIEGSSWDCSQYYRFKENAKKGQKEEKFIVLLEGITPIFKGDSLLEKHKPSFTAKNWFPSICNFLDKLESQLKCETKVAAHPKSNHKDQPDYLGFRRVFFNETFDLIRQSNLVIGRNSAALSIAVLFNKPIVTIFNDELKMNKTDLRSINMTAHEMGVNSVNIDNNYLTMEPNNLIKFNKSKYEEFTRNFLTSRYDEMPNYKVILDEVFDIC